MPITPGRFIITTSEKSGDSNGTIRRQLDQLDRLRRRPRTKSLVAVKSPRL